MVDGDLRATAGHGLAHEVRPIAAVGVVVLEQFGGRADVRLDRIRGLGDLQDVDLIGAVEAWERQVVLDSLPIPVPIAVETLLDVPETRLVEQVGGVAQVPIPAVSLDPGPANGCWCSRMTVRSTNTAPCPGSGLYVALTLVAACYRCSVSAHG